MAEYRKHVDPICDKIRRGYEKWRLEEGSGRGKGKDELALNKFKAAVVRLLKKPNSEGWRKKVTSMSDLRAFVSFLISASIMAFL